ncbi:hypothetical protein K431DRAFT_286456 [Polychaeton citri CBS 116435]|uniref:Methyltransferase type 11 domain-containing protein n=1 Tax=Polychaeton citri CBS 116435 TaxID=1314669 RepID=A0A9P4UMI9_9PEZI|nr:hypothetical protein K431DRAFT_286456 [Polychaeton citri CBS 116435]
MAQVQICKQESTHTQILNWSNYTRYRPRYPQSLMKLIMDHHHARSDSNRLAHDIGSGPGIFATTLAGFFSHVHVSDPSAVSIKLARDNLSKWRAHNLWRGTFSFDVRGAESSDEGLAAGEVDLVTVMEAAHLVLDIDAMVEAIWRQLGSNGTMAVVVYSPAVQVVGEEPSTAGVRNAVESLFRKWTGEVLKAHNGEESAHAKTVFPQNQTGADFVPVPEEMFIQDATKRIRMNTYGKGNEKFGIPGVEHMTGRAKLRVGKEHRLYEFKTSEDVEAEGWRAEVDPDWFKGYIESLGQDGKMEVYARELEQVESAIRAASSTGRVTIEWVVALLLATKK